jgi:hypothetical protein
MSRSQTDLPSGTRHFEILAASFAAADPRSLAWSRTPDAIELRFDDDEEPSANGGAVVLLTPEAVELRLPTIDWTGGSHGPVPSSRLWRRLPIDRLDRVGNATDTDSIARTLLAAARRARRREIRRCPACGERVGPEHMTDGMCHGCAARDHGVVY